MANRKTAANRSIHQLTHDEGYLFDRGERTCKEVIGFGESYFCFLNRLAWESVTEARRNLESWFSKFPSKKRSDIRKRFRGGDQEHHGALLELATHEILSAVGTDINVDPCLNGLTPDYSVRFRNDDTLVECTVAQDSDEHFKIARRESFLMEAIDSSETGSFWLQYQLHKAGSGMPPTRGIQREIGKWFGSLDPIEVVEQQRVGNLDFGSFTWSKAGWIVQLWPIPGRPDHLKGTGTGTIDGRRGFGCVDDDIQLRKVLEVKADKYRCLDTSFLVIIGSNKWPTYPSAVLHALFGSRALRYSESKIRLDETWPFSDRENFLGSPSKPRNRHVSAVLHKSFAHHASIWGLCHLQSPWVLIHNPWAIRPLQRGIFPFAFELALEHTLFVEVEPTCTINRHLGLSDPWPGNDH